MALELCLLFPIFIIVGFMQLQPFVAASEPQLPCYFIFGDSLVDSGNNNELMTAAKANYKPYGVDFPQGVNGRFTNGRTIADIIGQLLGFPNFIPPYATATDQEINTGVNYGSGSAGIREESGSHLGDRISLDRQLINHRKTISRLSILQGNKTFTHEYLQKCIYLSNIGSNDYINNYLIPNIYPTSNIYTNDQYAAVLTLYNLGARKIVVFGLGNIGCAPAMIARFGTGGKPCVESIIDAVKLFNERLKALVDELNKDYFDARFTFINLESISAPQGGFREFIPPYANATDKQISKGVNYGSGSAGIREESGSHLGDRISLDRQLLRHKSTISRLSRFQRKTLKKCIYVVNIGSNDYINNYLLYDIYNTSHIYSTDQYAEVLIQQYSRQLRTLYRLGGRKVAVFGLTRMGCTPVEMNKFGTDGKPCVEFVNNAIKLFNDRLMPLVDELNNNNSDARFTFINLTSILLPLGDVPLPSTPCCHVRKDWQCVPNSFPCMIRTLSIFYDGFHPSEISNIVIATRSYIGLLPMDASPYDIIMGLMQVQTFVVASQQPQVPCYFIFGDSSVDSGNNNGLNSTISGNNNRLNTTSKANYPPYGIDFPQGVTGRFTNGRTFADIIGISLSLSHYCLYRRRKHKYFNLIGQLLGFDKFIPPYATTTDEQNNKGVNYASAAAGIREETGSQLGERISFDRQLLNHNSTISHLSHLQRNTQFLKKCIYLVKIGINDYSNNYFVPDYYNTSRIYTTDQYATVLIQQYSQQLRVCIMLLMPSFFHNRVYNSIFLINIAWQTLYRLGGRKIAVLGMRNGPCCEVGEGWVCIPNGSPCQDRALFTFYDGFHPTEASNTITATRAYTARSPMDASPYDIISLQFLLRGLHKPQSMNCTMKLIKTSQKEFLDHLVQEEMEMEAHTQSTYESHSISTRTATHMGEKLLLLCNYKKLCVYGDSDTSSVLSRGST
ncbi:Lipase, GDSL [Cynara cardunculus var. scolymus]|uniref:Lipase, GDSL n=1 Tax=Cynara cardunculus var. scolymus TaxID=59895 RepID=A0A103XTZ8_CYNCS|nr:Lipase, GDSL [Cynara cardunculus var. scolymus]